MKNKNELYDGITIDFQMAFHEVYLDYYTLFHEIFFDFFTKTPEYDKLDKKNFKINNFFMTSFIYEVKLNSKFF